MVVAVDDAEIVFDSDSVDDVVAVVAVVDGDGDGFRVVLAVALRPYADDGSELGLGLGLA